MTPTTYGRDFAYCLKSHGGVRGVNASLWRFLLRCTLFCHSVATFLTSVSSYEGGCGFEDYINCYKNNDLEAASRMLYKIKNDSIFPLSENERKQYMEALSQFRIYDAKATGFILRSDKNNEMTITLQIIPSPQGDIEKGTGVMKFALNPILKDGQWYLTLRDLNAEGVENYYEEHAHD